MHAVLLVPHLPACGIAAHDPCIPAWSLKGCTCLQACKLQEGQVALSPPGLAVTQASQVSSRQPADLLLLLLLLLIMGCLQPW